LVALREDQHAAESLAVNTTRCKVVTLVISVFFTSLAGTFYAQYYAFIDPDIVFTSQISIELALLCIIGGIGTVFGPVVGACFMIPLDVLLRGWLGGVFSGLNFVIYGLVLICAVRYFPIGIFGWLKKISNKYIQEPVCALPPDINFAAVPAYSKPSPRPKNTGETPLIKVISISKRFGGLQAVKDLSFSIYEGEILGLIGPNGAGKTTVFNLISGFISPDSGTIHFGGKDITSLGIPHRFCRQGIGRTFQIVKPFQSMTVLENVMVGVFSRVRDVSVAREEALRIIERIHLSPHVSTQPCQLTLANRKRLELGRALATGPRLLLLDEVMAGLNPKETEDIIAVIRSLSDEGVTIFLIEHVMKAVMALSDRITVINNGMKIVDGLPEEIARDKRVIDAYLGEQCDAATA
jgi:branched-chain amino acid transport system permease protein